MYSKELESIIEAALADGTLTDRERAVLHRRAMAEGVDIYELDVIIEGKLAKMKKEEDWLKTDLSVQKDVEKMGNIVKCPNCGAPVIPGKGKCEECGHYFVNVAANKNAVKLADQLKGINNATKKAAIIDTFLIPNTKVDLIEFMTLLLPLSAGRRVSIFFGNMFDPDSKYTREDEKIVGTACYKKLTECANKIYVTFPNDPDFNHLLQEYEKERRKISIDILIPLAFLSFIVIGSFFDKILNLFE